MIEVLKYLVLGGRKPLESCTGFSFGRVRSWPIWGDKGHHVRSFGLRKARGISDPRPFEFHCVTITSLLNRVAMMSQYQRILWQTNVRYHLVCCWARRDGGAGAETGFADVHS